MMLLENKKLAIVGGGPGGLTLARLLQCKGVDVRVYERDVDPSARVQGATLDLHYESGLKAIAAAGLTDVFAARYRPGAAAGRVVSPQGEIVFDEHGVTVPDDFSSPFFRPEIDRGPLRDLLLESLESGTVVWDAQFVGMSPVGDGWELRFKDGQTAMADIVIGADGVHSRIRPYVTTVKPFYAGVVILLGNVPDAATAIPEMHALLNGGKIYAHGNGDYIHVSSKGDGSIDLYISCKKPEGWSLDRGPVRDWFVREFPSWDSIWLNMIEHVSSPLVVRPQYCMPLDRRWETRSNLTLLGDAAHIMPPSGEGVNLAMLDALELSEVLTGDGYATLGEAIEVFEGKMRERALREARDSMEMVAWMHADGAQETMVRFLGAVTNGGFWG